MDPKFRSSFIPKKPLSTKTEGAAIKKRKSFNMMVFIATAVFIVAIIASAAVFGFKFVLEDNINQKGIALTEARKLLDLNEIQEFKELDERLSAAWKLLGNHKVTARVFTVLEENTLHSIQFDEYEFKGDLTILLSGRAASFNSLALQSDVFDALELFQDTKYSEFGLNELGEVEFTITTSLNQDQIRYISQE